MIFRALVCVLALSLTAQKSAAELPDFTEIVDVAAPAVVKILVEYEAENSRYQEQLEELPESLRRFFDFAAALLFPEIAPAWAPVSS